MSKCHCDLNFRYHAAWFEGARRIIEDPVRKAAVEAARYWLTHQKPISQRPQVGPAK